jgi:hypothetical protein
LQQNVKLILFDDPQELRDALKEVIEGRYKITSVSTFDYRHVTAPNGFKWEAVVVYEIDNRP